MPIYNPANLDDIYVKVSGDTMTGTLKVPLGAGFGSAGESITSEFVDIDNVNTNISGANYNLVSLMQVEPAGTSTASYRSVFGFSRLDTAQSLSGGVVGVFGQAIIQSGLAAVLTGATGSNGLIGAYFTANAADATVTQASGVVFDMPNVNNGVITNCYGLRIGSAGVTGSGSITNLYGIAIPDVSLGTSKNADIYHASSTPSIMIANNATLIWKDFGGNTLMSIADAGTRGNAIITGNVTIGNGAVGIDFTLTFNGETNDGVITWMEDEDFFQFSDDIKINDGENIILDTTTGTKIGTATNQKLGFFNANPIIQQTTSSQTPATFAANTSGISDDTATWNGYTVGDIIAILQAFGFIA